MDKKNSKKITSYRDLDVYQRSYKGSIIVCRDIVPKLPKEERYDLTDQLRRSSKAVPRLIAEGCHPDTLARCSGLAGEGSRGGAISDVKKGFLSASWRRGMTFRFKDFLQQRNLPLWDKTDPRAREIRALAYRSNRSYETYSTYLKEPEIAANTIICLIHQTNFLLDRQLQSLEKSFLKEGGF